MRTLLSVVMGFVLVVAVQAAEGAGPVLAAAVVTEPLAEATHDAPPPPPAPPARAAAADPPPTIAPPPSEMPVESPKAGKVESVVVAEGQAVDEGAVLLTLV